MTDEAGKRYDRTRAIRRSRQWNSHRDEDLEIRGAGDLLGGGCSGFANEIGFDTYQKILAKPSRSLKKKISKPCT